MAKHPTIACPHFARCGGCQWVDKSYAEQLSLKQAKLDGLFAFAGFGIMPPVLPSPVINGYRHKVQLPFGTKRLGRRSLITIGCYARDSHTVVDQHACLVQDHDLTAIAWAMRDWANEAGLSVYDERRHEGFLRHVLLRKGAGTNEILLGLVTNGPRPVGTRRLAAGILEAAQAALHGSEAKIVGVVQNVNTRRTNVVLGDHEFAWWGAPFIHEKLGPFRFSLGLSTFFQVNPFQTPRLYDEALRWIENGPAVLDCYCGVGALSLWVAQKSRYVTGIEENSASTAAAEKAKGANGVRNVRFIRDSVEYALPELAAGGYDSIILDPPRKGLDEPILAIIRDSAIKRVIYVSCNPETLARDMQFLLPKWKPVSVQGVDMFPHTEHIEAVAVMDRHG